MITHFPAFQSLDSLGKATFTGVPGVPFHSCRCPLVYLVIGVSVHRYLCSPVIKELTLMFLVTGVEAAVVPDPTVPVHCCSCLSQPGSRYHYNVANSRVEQHVEKGNDDGLAISSVGCCQELWALIMDAGTGFTAQVYNLTTQFLPKVSSPV